MTMRVRFAPSPTGYLHVGGARTALFNWLLARGQGGEFILRIEDTDRARSKPEHTEAILHGLDWLGLDWDGEPHFQSEGVERHRADALRLLDECKAYRDFADPSTAVGAASGAATDEEGRRRVRELAESVTPEESRVRADAGESFAIRFRVPAGETSWEDAVHGRRAVQNAAIPDLVVLRRDGTPTYNLAVVSDDADMGITHVIRGDDHLSNTPKQILLYQALGWPVPVFAHVPLILGPDGKRLSKRHGATAVGDYESRGILPDAMVNFLALLGWSPGDDTEVMDREELVARFSLGRVLKKSSVFDVKKLEWLNGQHLARTAADRLEPLVTAKLQLISGVSSDYLRGREVWYRSLIDLLRVRARTVDDIARQAVVYLTDDLEYDEPAVRKHWLKDPNTTVDRLEALRERLADVEWEKSALETAIRGMAEELEVGAGKVIHPLRVSLTGMAASPGIFDVLTLLGRDRALERMDRAIEGLKRGTFAGTQNERTRA
jgi:glutamyl-tRNA synthetase